MASPASAARRRSVISVQDLLCRNSSHSAAAAAAGPVSAAAYVHAAAPAAPVSAAYPYPHSSSSSPPHIHPTPHPHPHPHHPHHHHAHPADPKPDLSRPKSVRGPWRIEEDRLLIDLVNKYGPRHWSAIATHFPRRTGKQARERWMNQLNPNLKKKNWSPDEDRVILRAHASLGNKWSAIANLLPGRTDNSVKNRFNSTLKRAMKEHSLISNTLDIDDFVHSLHAKPYLIEPPHHHHHHHQHHHDRYYDSSHSTAHDRYPSASRPMYFPDTRSEDPTWHPSHLQTPCDIGLNTVPFPPTSAGQPPPPINTYWRPPQESLHSHRDRVLGYQSSPMPAAAHNTAAASAATAAAPIHHPPYRQTQHDAVVPSTLRTPVPMQPALSYSSSRESSPESFTVNPRGELVRSATFAPHSLKYGAAESARLLRDDCASRQSPGGTRYALPMRRVIEKRHLRSCSF